MLFYKGKKFKGDRKSLFIQTLGKGFWNSFQWMWISVSLLLLFLSCNYNPLGGENSHVDNGNSPFLNTPVPFAVNGVLITDGQVNLAWDVAKNADDYTVVYGTSPGNYPNTVASCSHIQTLVCVVTGLVNGTPYYFNVVARNRFGTTNMKNEVLATPNLFSLLLTPKSRSALVSWGAADAGIGNTNYTVQSGSSPSTINNALGPTNSTDLTTTVCNQASANPATNGINTTGIVDTDYVNRVQTIPGYSLTTAGQTQIKNFLNQYITDNIPFPDVLYAMQNQQNAGKGTSGNNTTLFDLYCNLQNATLVSSSFTWDNNGVKGDRVLSTTGIASSNNGIFDGTKPSTMVAYAQTPVPVAGNYQGVMGYEGNANVSRIPTGIGYDYNSINFLEDISGTGNIPNNSSSGGNYDFIGRSLSGSTIVADTDGTQNNPTTNNNALGFGKFILGSLPPVNRGNYTLTSYLPFAAAWTNLALNFNMMEKVRSNYQMNLVGKQLIVGTTNGKLVVGCSLTAANDIFCPSTATVVNSSNAAINGLNVTKNAIYSGNLSSTSTCAFTNGVIGTCTTPGPDNSIMGSFFISNGYITGNTKTCAINSDGSINSSACQNIQGTTGINNSTYSTGYWTSGILQFGSYFYSTSYNTYVAQCTTNSSYSQFTCSNVLSTGTSYPESLAYYTLPNGNNYLYVGSWTTTMQVFQLFSNGSISSTAIQSNTSTNGNISAINNGYLYASSYNGYSALIKCPIILTGTNAGQLSTCTTQSTFVIGGITYTPSAVGFY